MFYFSPSTCGFYREDIHGPKVLLVPDPSWSASAEDPDASPPLVSVPNPDCKMPADATIQVSDEDHAALAGRRVIAGPGGYPVVQVTTNADLLAAIRMRRDNLLRECDWTQIADSPLSAQAKSDWAAYRQALRDLPGNVADPANVDWPVSPA